MTNNYCNKCGACCKNIKADLNKKILYWDCIQPLEDEFAKMLVPTGIDENIYTCIHLHNNICTNNNKPQICINYPSSPFAKLTENCGYTGFIFMQSEKIKQKIRKLKEEIIHYNAIISTTNDKKEQNQLRKIITSHQRFIDKYKDYGSENW